MFLFDTHRSVAQRLRLSADSALGAGNYFWRVCRTVDDLDTPLLFHRRPGPDGELRGHSLGVLRARVVAYADWYSAHGVGVSSRVGVLTADGLRGFLHHIAVTAIGAVTVPVNPNMAPGTAAAYFRRTGTRVLVGDAELIAVGSEMTLVATLDEIDVQAPPSTATVPRSPHRHGPDDLILISHSSGTTGTPKPTLFTHQGFFVGKRERLWNFPSRRSDRLLTALPHSHSAGLSYLGLAVMLGLPTLLTDDRSGAGVASAMNGFRPTVVIGFPLSLAELPVDRLSAEARQEVHTWMGMGDASHERHIRPLVRLGRRQERGQWLPGSVYVDGLGSSEMGMVLFKNTHTARTSHYGRMIGKPVPVVREAVVLDADGNRLAAGEAGLLGVRTPSVTPGYWDDPELTAKAHRGDYFLTGDVVRRDEDGNFYHLDRTPDVIATADGPVYSLPLEEVVLNASDALDAAVVAVDDPAHPTASRPVAVLLFQDSAPASAEELLARCNKELGAAGLAPLHALLVAADRDELPVGVTGKVLKRVLRERHRSLLGEQARPGLAFALGPRRPVSPSEGHLHDR
ncbi:class I adenylate-forming enzyme family protein [Streptomyces sp. UNOC14_S4]|uniref:class I adenylate-forming enzyme family protein n=1 Tax=Streptomyces sp. UNOC14_S4 TaxID=2872340 RepID=UPI001E652FBC|nr:class I adenylate-forming enzyme family protein [Streptomyces sp. UNOC14_S4]MCC3769293.1 acyl--CoA ligase [Streptomyces sp. UNOC14_S4]